MQILDYAFDRMGCDAAGIIATCFYAFLVDGSFLVEFGLIVGFSVVVCDLSGVGLFDFAMFVFLMEFKG